MDSEQPSWESLFAKSLLKRISPEQFRTFVKSFQSKYDTPSSQRLIDILFGESRKTAIVDPRLPLYTRELIYLGLCDAADVLAYMLPSSEADSSNNKINFRDHSMLEMETHRPSLEATILQMLIIEVNEGLLKTRSQIQAVLNALSSWVAQYPGSSTLGYLISATLNSPLAQEMFSQTSNKKLRASLGRCLSSLITQLSQTNLQLATTLDFWQKQYDLRADTPGQSLDLIDGVDLGALSFQQNVIDNAPLNTRAGLYIYLNAMLYGRPMFNDMMVINYLGVRYKNDVPNLVTDLILASFDIVANAMYRSEATESITLLRSFLVNKLPVFLKNYAPMIFQPLTVEYCISQALIRVDPAAFPSFSQMFDLLGRNSMLSEARQEFLFACALHQLIPEQSIEALLGDVPMQSLPASGRYAKEELVAQCAANPTKIEELIGELENMEGNAGEIAAALIDIIHSLCANNDTMTLKGVCNLLSRKPLALDVVMLFTQSNHLLRPLCHILDNWQEHEDQGEYQPVYDEFGSILLLIVIAQNRYKLHPHDLGVDSTNSFVLKYMREACMVQSPEDLTQHENKLLGGWIRGLFDTEGISDELMSMCRPMEFHLLVATLFDQSLKACQFKYLALDTLRGGFEYLLEPFLLPSLVAGLTWFAHKVWETHEKSDALETAIPALHTLLKPPSMSSDSSAMHAAVLAIVAKPLEDSLSYAQRQQPLRTDINPLIEVLKPYTHRQRREASFYSELENWATTPGGGLLAALRHTIEPLIPWTSAFSTSADITPPHYTHRQLVETLKIMGAKAVLQFFLDELMAHYDNGGLPDMDIVLDIIVAMITAPQHQFLSPSGTMGGDGAHVPQRQLSLRDALHAEFLQAFHISKTNLPRATIIVRLYRRVEAYLERTGTDASGVGGATDVLLHGVVRNAAGMPTADIDEVLQDVEADTQIAQDFLATGNTNFLGVR